MQSIAATKTPSVGVQGLHHATLPQTKRSSSSTYLLLPKQCTYTPRPSRQQLRVVSWGWFKKVGLQKPAWLPDFGATRRRDLLLHFFSTLDRRVYEDILSPSFRFVEESNDTRTYSREDFMNLLCNCIAPAIPDFSWTPATDGTVSADGYAVVEVQPTGHHTGAPLNFPKLPSVPPSSMRFVLPPAFIKVKVEEGHIQEIIELKGESTGLMALYRALAQHAQNCKELQ